MTRHIDPNAVFELARRYGERADIALELDWQRSTNPESFSEQDLLRETAWVVLCSGFREKVVRRNFDYISLCFFDWESAEQIHQHSSVCVNAARRSFNNERKLRAIAECAGMVASAGFFELKRLVLQDPVTQLQRFPFVGPITGWHLAKNLGVDVAKPDRHLVRLARACGYDSATDLCSYLADTHFEQVKVIDLMLWRYLADHPGFLLTALTVASP